MFAFGHSLIIFVCLDIGLESTLSKWHFPRILPLPAAAVAMGTGEEGDPAAASNTANANINGQSNGSGSGSGSGVSNRPISMNASKSSGSSSTAAGISTSICGSDGPAGSQFNILSTALSESGRSINCDKISSALDCQNGMLDVEKDKYSNHNSVTNDHVVAIDDKCVQVGDSSSNSRINSNDTAELFDDHLQSLVGLPWCIFL